MASPEYITERVEAKKRDYRNYHFAQLENNAIMTFFDLAQEFDDLGDFFSLCVAIPKVFFNLSTSLYLISPKMSEIVLVAKTKNISGLNGPPPEDVVPGESPYYTERSLVLTIRGKKFLMDQLPFKATRDVLGMMEVYPIDGFGPHHELFFEKFANRIGFNMHNRLLVEKNVEHLRFIRTLVADIEHNIIQPNMVYKLFLRRLRGKITKNREIEDLITRCSSSGADSEGCLEAALEELIDVNAGLTEDMENIEQHYHNMTLFLETLLRRSHFDQGRLIPRTKQCNMKRDVIEAQLQRYMENFEKAGISVDDRSSGVPDEEVISVVDVGLIAQVFANLFSNALKYTREITTEGGVRKKYVAYGHETLHDYFGQGRDGIKYNVFSTGSHISQEERERIFDEGYRGTNIANRPGTGHGLAFIKNAVEIHGGVVGYEPTAYGNNFYIILPK